VCFTVDDRPAKITSEIMVGRKVSPVLTLAVYVAPFVVIGVAAKLWMRRRGVELTDVQAEGDPHRKRRPRFLLGIWRDEGRD
jgi:hypothetical protein